MSDPVVAALAADLTLAELAEATLKSPVVAFRATLLDKSSSANWLVGWHQDTALPLVQHHETAGWGPWAIKHGVRYAHAPAAVLDRVVALRVHLDDSDEANGPLLVLPGSHCDGVLDDDQIRSRARSIEPATCTAPAGSVVIMRPLIVHASSKVRNARRRRVLHIEYASKLELDQRLEIAIV